MLHCLHGHSRDRCKEQRMELKTALSLSAICASLTELAGKVRDETNAAVATNDHVTVIKHYDQLRQATALIKESREALEQLEMNLSREQVPDVMRAHNIRNVTIEGVGRVTLGTR